MKKLVIGNAAIDGILAREVSVVIRDNSIILDYNGHRIEIPVRDGPIRAGGKYTAKINFWEALQSFPRTEQFGGGGYLSATTLRKISDGSVYYLDISTPSLDTSVPGTSLADRLQSINIHPYFLGARPIPFNVVLGDRSDKIIVKSRLGNTTFGVYHHYLVNALVADCQGILFNSLKDTALVELAVDSANGKTLVGVITNSLHPDFVLEKIIPNCICQFNYDEFGCIVNPDHKVVGDEETRIEGAFEGIKRIRADYNPRAHTYVTLGRNGVLCSENSEIYHVRFKGEVLEKIRPAVNQNPASTCGAGDAHAASIFNDEVSHLPITEIAQRACIIAVRYLGYDGTLTETDFVLSRHNSKVAIALSYGGK